jgi:hypothetical protein
MSDRNPGDFNSYSGTASWGTWAGWGVAGAGYGLLLTNPHLTHDWAFHMSPSGRVGPSKDLGIALRNQGISVVVSNAVPQGAVRGAGSHAIGLAGERATAAFYEGLGWRNITSKPGIPAAGSRVPDFVGHKPGFFGGQRIHVESKVGYRGLSKAAGPGTTSGQLSADGAAQFNNRVARGVGKGLGIAGIGFDFFTSARDAADLAGKGDTVGAGRVGAGFAGRLAGGIAGAKGGFAGGAALGTPFGGVGAVPGAFIGGIFGGIVGAIFGGKAAERGYDAAVGSPLSNSSSGSEPSRGGSVSGGSPGIGSIGASGSPIGGGSPGSSSGGGVRGSTEAPGSFGTRGPSEAHINDTIGPGRGGVSIGTTPDLGGLDDVIDTNNFSLEKSKGAYIDSVKLGNDPYGTHFTDYDVVNNKTGHKVGSVTVAVDERTVKKSFTVKNLDGTVYFVDDLNDLTNQNKCFYGGTIISLSGNIYKKISEVVVGDIVVSFRSAGVDKEMQPRRVTRLFRNVTQEWLKITPAPGHEAAAERAGFTELVVTPGHHVLAPDGVFRQIERQL